MFKTGNYAKVWEIKDFEKGDKYVDARITTSRKNEEGEYETDFSGYVRAIGDACKVFKKLDEEDVIVLGEVGVSTIYDKKKEKNYINFLIFSCEKAEKKDKK